MAFPIPKSTPVPHIRDISYWEGYELIESLTADGPLAHQTLVKARLDEMKLATDIPVTLKAITTRVFTSETPMQEQRYITTICYSVLGSPTVFPAP